METSPLKLKAGIKRKRVSCSEKCLICQQGEKYGDLRNASEAGQQTFLRCLKRRTSSQDLEIYDKIEHLIDMSIALKIMSVKLSGTRTVIHPSPPNFTLIMQTTSEERNSSKETSSLNDRLSTGKNFVCFVVRSRTEKTRLCTECQHLISVKL